MAKRIETGIYVRTEKESSTKQQSPEEMAAVLSRALKSPLESLLRWLEEVEASIIERLQELTFADREKPRRGETAHLINLGQGPDYYILRRDLSVRDRETALDAIEAMQQIHLLRISLKNIDPGRIAIGAIGLGRIVERMKMRPFEPLAATGRKNIRGAILGGKRKKLSEEEIQRRLVEWQYLVGEMMQRHPHLGYTAVTDRVGRNLKQKVSGRTIRRYTRDPEE